ncbi:hypothetical protein GGR56DRAFT_125417 [Xylariaceae sp. FL0804]|nr:hypothetical protein GGR56DRAFT_125417 [Xylariaceae sp. FL0804]
MGGGGLAASRWNPASMAPVPSWPRPPPPQQRHLPNPPPLQPAANPGSRPSPQQQQLSRFLKIVARLKWKIPFLELGYATATNRAGKTLQQADADEIHFKLDFHEYYMLVERTLVHLMGVYGIVVDNGATSASHHYPLAPAHAGPAVGGGSDGGGYGHVNGNYGNGNGNGGVSSSGSVSYHRHGGKSALAPPGRVVPARLRHDSPRPYQHRYHANVLAALDDPANPLHGVLGRGTAVREQLARAKDLRNRWKNADDDDDDDDDDDKDDEAGGLELDPEEQQRQRRWRRRQREPPAPAPLEAYNLERILQDVFAALEQAYHLAESHVRGLSTSDVDMRAADGGSGGGGGGGSHDNGDYPVVSADWTVQEDDWEWMVDAMDWEAV